MILLKVFGVFAQTGGLWLEGALGGFGGYLSKFIGAFGDSFCNVIACFCGNHIIKWCLFRLLRAEVSSLSVFMS